jgi:type IV secretion system protein VirB10
MVQSLQLAAPGGGDQDDMRRLNRLPIIAATVIILLFLGIVVVGLSWRGMNPNRDGEGQDASRSPATSFGERLKRGIGDGIIGEPEQRDAFQPAMPPIPDHPIDPPLRTLSKQAISEPVPLQNNDRGDDEWRTRLKREQDEQFLREQNRQRMARLQAEAAALDSPLKVEVTQINREGRGLAEGAPASAGPGDSPGVYASAWQAGLAQSTDANGQLGKADFFNQDIKDLGYLGNRVVPQISPFELKRGSVIPATLLTGLNSDLPGRISAQVSQNVYDSATGHHLLVPQGAKLFGRYDAKISFGQQRVLVVWTDLIFPNGSTLQIGGMAGTDAEGYGGFSDKIDSHLWRTFGSAALVALIGTGIDMSLPESSTLATQDTASDAARRNFAETFGRAAEQSILKNLNVQPTLRIRPGYRFNVLVDQDVVFPGGYRV